MSSILYKGRRPDTVPKVTRDYCKGCELCILLCPPQGLRLSQDYNAAGYHTPVLTGTCTGCRVCETVCPDFAIKVMVDR